MYIPGKGGSQKTTIQYGNLSYHLSQTNQLESVTQIEVAKKYERDLKNRGDILIEDPKDVENGSYGFSAYEDKFLTKMLCIGRYFSGGIPPKRTYNRPGSCWINLIMNVYGDKINAAYKTADSKIYDNELVKIVVPWMRIKRCNEWL